MPLWEERGRGFYLWGVSGGEGRFFAVVHISGDGTAGRGRVVGRIYNAYLYLILVGYTIKL